MLTGTEEMRTWLNQRANVVFTDGGGGDLDSGIPQGIITFEYAKLPTRCV
jgi:hypothetical protein